VYGKATNQETTMTTPDSLPALLAEHAELEGRLADPGVHADQALARRLAEPRGT